ncbi:hypothetical protein Ri1_37450 [Aeromonas dhakensis]|nr:hypothetical protein Ri1_37450 [Aeromonas dhakensis]
MWINAEPVNGALVSLAIGLIIGLERGWQVRQLGDNQRIAGMRTYGLIGLLGGVCALLLPTLGPWLPLLGLLAVVIGCGLSVWLAQRWQGEFGLTSSVAMLLTYLLGLMSVLLSPSEAVACAVLAALLMGLKGKIQQGMLFLSETEFHATLRFLLISLVLLPVLPNEEMGPLDAFNPFKIWLMVVVIAGISFCGHFAVRLLGTRAGLVLTSMLAGLASSTALTLQFARLNKEQGGWSGCWPPASCWREPPCGCDCWCWCCSSTTSWRCAWRRPCCCWRPPSTASPSGSGASARS